MRITVVLSATLAALVAFFSLQNAQATRVSFFSWYVEAPLVLLLLGTFAAGVAAAWLALLPGSIRKSLEISRLSRERDAASPPASPAKDGATAGGGAKGDERVLPPPPGTPSAS